MSTALSVDPSTTPVLRARQLRKQFCDGDRSLTILDNIDLDISAGERVALIGASGSGKSTLLQILGGLDPAYDGTVWLNGIALSTLSDRALSACRNQFLGFVFQSHNLLQHLTALDNVLLPATFSTAPIDRERARGLLARVGLGDKCQRYPYQLSGGERQRVAIARALYQRPRLVLCDEPTGNLDGTTAHHVIELLTQLADEGVAMIIATHDRHLVDASDRILSLHAGQIISPAIVDKEILW